MIINESGLTRAIKKAYRFGGYTVFRRGETVTVYCDQWCVQCEREIFPRKALGAIVEHAGFMPDDGEAYQISKSGEPQVEGFDMAMNTARYWSSAERTQAAEVTTLTFCGYQLIQDTEPGGTGVRKLHGAPLGSLKIMEWPVVRDKRAVIADGCRAVYTGDKELVSIGLISSRSFQEEERRLSIWGQLEQTDLRPGGNDGVRLTGGHLSVRPAAYHLPSRGGRHLSGPPGQLPSRGGRHLSGPSGHLPSRGGITDPLRMRRGSKKNTDQRARRVSDFVICGL